MRRCRAHQHKTGHVDAKTARIWSTCSATSHVFLKESLPRVAAALIFPRNFYHSKQKKKNNNKRQILCQNNHICGLNYQQIRCSVQHFSLANHQCYPLRFFHYVELRDRSPLTINQIIISLEHERTFWWERKRKRESAEERETETEKDKNMARKHGYYRYTHRQTFSTIDEPKPYTTFIFELLLFQFQIFSIN